MSLVEVKVPDIGDFDAVEIIEVLVSVGDEVTENQDIITLESDKAAMEIPSSAAGKVAELLVSVGDKVKEGDVILKLESATSETAAEKPAEKAAPAKAEAAKPAKAAPKAAAKPDHSDMHAEVLVLGSGPGGYTAAFRAAE